ncbi:hypothetical protein [Pseudomonas phage TL]|uniref:Uncharacterized protein n=1 Tax=Pseudomonas phage TL TaxID=1406974 RepID=W0XAD3_9CAUD|nr:hypothetical protein CF76_gp11 [Pseudomonas phage TL]CDI06773.1 hypothetical protein [Pseudomonas phage TL]
MTEQMRGRLREAIQKDLEGIGEDTSDLYDNIHKIEGLLGHPGKPPHDWGFYVLMFVMFISLCMVYITPLLYK